MLVIETKVPQAGITVQPAQAVNSQIEPIENKAATEAPTEFEKPEASQPQADENTSKPRSVTRHLITFMGNGVWNDAKGEVWGKNHKNPNIKSDREYTDEEYQERGDIHFMVSYGSMKHTVVKL